MLNNVGVKFVDRNMCFPGCLVEHLSLELAQQGLSTFTNDYEHNTIINLLLENPLSLSF